MEKKKIIMDVDTGSDDAIENTLCVVDLLEAKVTEYKG